MKNATQTADTIISQLGGHGHLVSMISASDFDVSANGVWFAFKGSRVTNAIEIKVEGDLYNVEFFKGSKSVGTSIGIGAAELCGCIEQKTKLYLSL